MVGRAVIMCRGCVSISEVLGLQATRARCNERGAGTFHLPLSQEEVCSSAAFGFIIYVAEECEGVVRDVRRQG